MIKRIFKKIFLFILVFLGFYAFADYYDVLRYIKNNKLEYIKLNGNIYVGKKYISSKGRDYYFLGKVKGLNFTDLTYNKISTYISYFGKGIFLVNEKDKVILYILDLDKLKRRKNIVNLCIFLSKPEISDLIKLHYDFKIVNIDKILSYDVNTDLLSCGWYGNYVYFNTDQFTRYDLNYFVKNYKYIYKQLNLFKRYKFDKNLLIRKIYNYILSKVSYDYNILQRVNNGKNINNISPWLISTFFKYGKLVCDGYVKTFILFLRYYGIKPERIVGKLQPIDQKRRNLGVALHSWVKIGNLYYDPTFDDTISKNGNNDLYFSKPKKCFNLDHYTSGLVLFTSIDDRWNYIVENFDYLNKYCPGILKSILFLDDKIEDYIRYLFVKYNKNYIASDLCEKFDICIKANSKQSLLKKLKSYRLTITIANKIKVIDFSNLDDSLGNINFESKVKTKNKVKFNFKHNSKTGFNSKVNLLQKQAKIIFNKKIRPFLLKYSINQREEVKKLLIKRLIVLGKKINSTKQKILILYLIKEIKQWK